MQSRELLTLKLFGPKFVPLRWGASPWKNQSPLLPVNIALILNSFQHEVAQESPEAGELLQDRVQALAQHGQGQLWALQPFLQRPNSYVSLWNWKIKEPMRALRINPTFVSRARAEEAAQPLREHPGHSQHPEPHGCSRAGIIPCSPTPPEPTWDNPLKGHKLELISQNGFIDVNDTREAGKDELPSTSALPKALHFCCSYCSISI